MPADPLPTGTLTLLIGALLIAFVLFMSRPRDGRAVPRRPNGAR